MPRLRLAVHRTVRADLDKGFGPFSIHHQRPGRLSPQRRQAAAIDGEREARDGGPLVAWRRDYSSSVCMPSWRILRYRFERCRPIRLAASLMLFLARSMFFLMYSI
jgi:hypothetical protein